MGSDDGQLTKTASLVQSQEGSQAESPGAGRAGAFAEVRPGDCLGRYTVRALVGAGGMGQVYAAVDAELGRTVAVKLIRADHDAAGTSARTRLLREAQALARLHHPNVVTVHDVGAHGDRVFLAMELVEGPTLGEWLRQRRRSWREVRDVFRAAGRGLAAAHAAGIVHRDFKPQNVIVSRARRRRAAAGAAGAPRRRRVPGPRHRGHPARRARRPRPRPPRARAGRGRARAPARPPGHAGRGAERARRRGARRQREQRAHRHAARAHPGRRAGSRRRRGRVGLDPARARAGGRRPARRGAGHRPGGERGRAAGGATPRRRAELLTNEATVLERGKRAHEAVLRLAEARRLLEADGGTDPHSPHLPLLARIAVQAGYAQGADGDYPGALASHRRAIELWQQAYGPDHPDEALGWHSLGQQLRMHGKPEEALAAFREAVRIREARLGASTSLAMSLTGVGCALQETGRYAESRPVLERALAMSRAQLPPGDLGLVVPLLALAVTVKHLGRTDEARAGYDGVIFIFERSGAKDVNLRMTLLNRGNLATEAHRCAQALPDYRRAAELFEEYKGPTSMYLISPLQAEGACLNELGRFAEAIPVLERALAIPTPGSGKDEQSVARFELGRALVESKRDRRRGMALVRTARAELAALGRGSADDLADVDTWLARRR